MWWCRTGRSRPERPSPPVPSPVWAPVCPFLGCQNRILPGKAALLVFLPRVVHLISFVLHWICICLLVYYICITFISVSFSLRGQRWRDALQGGIQFCNLCAGSLVRSDVMDYYYYYSDCMDGRFAVGPGGQLMNAPPSGMPPVRVFFIFHFRVFYFGELSPNLDLFASL